MLTSFKGGAAEGRPPFFYFKNVLRRPLLPSKKRINCISGFDTPDDTSNKYPARIV